MSVSNVGGFGLENCSPRQIKKMISSYVGENKSSSVNISPVNWNLNSRHRARWPKLRASGAIPTFFTGSALAPSSPTAESASSTA